MASASPTDSFDWLSQATARILGTSVAASPLRRDRLLKDMPEAERVAFSRALRQRFQRVVDERTERVTWVVAAGLPVSGTGGGDPELERLARTLIPPIRGALDEVAPHRCRDEACAQDVAAGIVGLRDQLMRLDEELRAPPTRGYIEYLIDQTRASLVVLGRLVHSNHAGLEAAAHQQAAAVATALRDIDAIAAARNATEAARIAHTEAHEHAAEIQRATRDLEDERDYQAVITAITIFDALGAAVTARLNAIGDIADVGALYRCVEQAAQPLSDAASNLLRNLASLGIDDRQLQQLGLDGLPAPAAGGQITLGELLRLLAEEPKLWLRFARTGSGQYVQRIVGSANRIVGVLRVDNAASARIVDALGLAADQCCDDGRSVLSEMRRLFVLSRSALMPISAARPFGPIVGAAAP